MKRGPRGGSGTPPLDGFRGMYKAVGEFGAITTVFSISGQVRRFSGRLCSTVNKPEAIVTVFRAIVTRLVNSRRLCVGGSLGCREHHPCRYWHRRTRKTKA
eukprot:2239855-Pyramimonas_sp.AAC.2